MMEAQKKFCAAVTSDIAKGQLNKVAMLAAAISARTPQNISGVRSGDDKAVVNGHESDLNRNIWIGEVPEPRVKSAGLHIWEPGMEMKGDEAELAKAMHERAERVNSHLAKEQSMFAGPMIKYRRMRKSLYGDRRSGMKITTDFYDERIGEAFVELDVEIQKGNVVTPEDGEYEEELRLRLGFMTNTEQGRSFKDIDELRRVLGVRQAAAVEREVEKRVERKHKGIYNGMHKSCPLEQPLCG